MLPLWTNAPFWLQVWLPKWGATAWRLPCVLFSFGWEEKSSVACMGEVRLSGWLETLCQLCYLRVPFWGPSNTKKQALDSYPNPLGNAVRVGNAKTDFLEAKADWLEKWHDEGPGFSLTSKTSCPLVLTLRAQSGLIKELLSEAYDFVMTSRLQSDPIARRFTQYRQMSGGRFLVSLREVTRFGWESMHCRSLVKADINFWKEDLGSDKPSLHFSALLALLSEHEIEIAESILDSSSEEVSTTIAVYIAKKLAKRSNCDSCKSLLAASSMHLAENHHLNLLSRGGLIVPSVKLAEYTSHCFAIMDYSYNIVQAHGVRDVRAAYTQIFDRFSPQIDICCSKRNNWGLKVAAKIVINTFFNNKQTVSSDAARKDTVVAFKKRQRTK